MQTCFPWPRPTHKIKRVASEEKEEANVSFLMLPKETSVVKPRGFVTIVRREVERKCEVESPHHDDIGRPGAARCSEVRTVR